MPNETTFDKVFSWCVSGFVILVAWNLFYRPIYMGPDDLRARAMQGRAESQYLLGDRLWNRVPWPYSSNPEVALLFFRLAAEQGHLDAQLQLGDMLGDWRLYGIEFDPVEAAYWYQLAAEQGERFAISGLGHLYLSDRANENMPRDDVQAYMWLSLALQMETEWNQDSYFFDEFTDRLDEVAAGMTREQITEAQRLAREWDEAHPRD